MSLNKVSRKLKWTPGTYGKKSCQDSTFQSFTDLTLAFKTYIKHNNVHQVKSQLAAKALLKEDINSVDLSVLNV